MEETICIIMPTKDRLKMAKRAIESISKQTYTNIELYIVDDNSSTENYSETLATFCENQLSFKFKVIRNKHTMGAPYSRNLGVSVSSSKYIAFIDDDDEWAPQKIEMQMKVLKACFNKENIGICFTPAYVLADKKSQVHFLKNPQSKDQKKAIIKECYICSSSVIVLRDAFLEAGEFDLKMRACQDWDLWTRIVFKGYLTISTNIPLTYVHKHDGPSIGTSNKAILGYSRYYQKHFLKYVTRINPIDSLRRLKLIIVTRLKSI